MTIAEINNNLVWEYTLVAICISGALIWMVVKLSIARKKKTTGCAGCALSETCKNKGIHKNNYRTENYPHNSVRNQSAYCDRVEPTARNSEHSAKEYKQPDQQKK